MIYYCTLGYTTQCDTSQCYFTSKSPEILDWIKEYINDKKIDMILKNIQKSKNVKFNVDQLKDIGPGYNTALKEGIIQTLNGNLVLYNPILANSRYVVLSVVSQSLSRIVFIHFHSRPSGGKMEEFKPSIECG